ncbi:MAG: hypothetical protein AAGA81_17445 [Acidobacteriota bacterium]
MDILPQSSDREPSSGAIAGRIALLGLVMTLVCLSLVSSEVSQAVESAGLEARWEVLLASQGVLEESSCGYLFKVSRPGQSGSAKVREVTPDFVTFTVQRDQRSFERVVPLGMLVYELPR